MTPSIQATLPKLPHDAIEEVSVYFAESWGNRTRIDYGSGMELNFLCWLFVCIRDILYLLTVFSELVLSAWVLQKRVTTERSSSEYSGGTCYAPTHETDSLTVIILIRYIEIMRILQSTYWLEPAGSHGVWGLDDYHFLPFLFGSSQLRGKSSIISSPYDTLMHHSGHKYIRPKSIHDAEIVDEYSKQYIYFASIKFINSVRC